MCLEVDESFPYRYIATEPMTVYKVICRNNKSMFRFFEYSKNKLYEIDGRLHTEIAEAIGDEGNEMYVTEGFHAFWSLEEASPWTEDGYYKIVTFTIPVGAHFYVGTNHTIVSDKIKSGDLVELEPYHAQIQVCMSRSVGKWSKS